MVSGLSHATNGAPSTGQQHHGISLGAGHSESIATGAAGNGAPPSRGLSASPATIAGYFRWKGAIDRIAALVLLLPGVPLMLILILVVRLTSRGAAIYH